MGYGIRIKVWGERALFTRPEMKVERVSYDVMTPSAARGVIEAIYYKPAIRWVIDAITVLNPIRFENIRRNELLGTMNINDVKAAAEGRLDTLLFQNTKECIVQRSSLLLKDVAYVIEAHFELTDRAGETDTVEKHYNIALRRIRKGQYFSCPYLGCREFPANFCLSEGKEESCYAGETRDLGYMLWDMDYQKGAEPIFWRAVMCSGRIEVPDLLKGGDIDDTKGVM